jgi:hypothetical protein
MYLGPRFSSRLNQHTATDIVWEGPGLLTGRVIMVSLEDCHICVYV